MKSAGTTMIRARVPISIPPTVPTPIEMFPFAPTPLANIRGSIPKIIVSDVMRIGRSRAFAAAIAAAVIEGRQGEEMGTAAVEETAEEEVAEEAAE